MSKCKVIKVEGFCHKDTFLLVRNTIDFKRSNLVLSSLHEKHILLIYSVACVHSALTL